MPELVAQRDAFGEALVDLGARNERVVVLDADLASSTKVSLFAAAYPDRFFQMGVTEQNMMGVAAGLATMGFVPFTSTFACFAAKRALDQIRISIAQPRLPVVVVGAYGSLLVGKNGKSHQAVQDAAIMRAMPNMTVVAPGDGVEAAKAVFAVADYGGPVYLRLTRDPCPVVFDDDYEFKIGPAVVVREGSDNTLVTAMKSVDDCLEAAEMLCDRIAIIHVGKIAACGTMDELRKGAQHGGGLEEIFLRLTGQHAARNLVDVLDA